MASPSLPQNSLAQCPANLRCGRASFVSENESLHSVQAGQQCARVAGLTAVPAAVVLWMLAGRGAVLLWGTAGATIGLLAGVGVLVFSCTTPEVLHLLT